LLVALFGAGCGSVRGASGPLVPIGGGLKGQRGLKATVYASGLRNASAFAFDRRGRLWVATSGFQDHRRDGVYLVKGAGARPVKVIEGLEGPLGLAWYRDRLYVASIGRVGAFGGLRGTRFATQTRILDGPVAGGENNNLVLSPGGRLLMGVSASCDHCKPKSKWSAAIVSFRPDGSGLRVYTSGVRAGYGLAYRPGTGDLLVSMNQRDDLGARTPGDWLAAVRQGQHWGFPGCYGQGGPACAGVSQPIAVLDKHAAAGGVAIWGNAAIVAEWQAGKVQRVSLEKSGSVAPFLAGVKNPLPVATKPGGSVLVGDWTSGTVYRIAER
jgi:glucose/arabinose dehydrogenase